MTETSIIIAPTDDPGLGDLPADLYRVVIADLNGVPLAEVPAKNLQFSYILNGPGAVDFTLPLLHENSTPELLQPGAREIHLRRNGAFVWGGYLWTVTANTSELTNGVRVSGQGWFSRLLRRYINFNKTFTAEEQFTIAWDLINTAQALYMDGTNLTRATVLPSGVLRDRTYDDFERKSLGEALQELAAVDDGFDFEITPEKVWITYYPAKGITSNGPNFELGKNIGGMSWTLDGSDLSSEFTAIGSGAGDTTLLSVASDPISLAQYGLLQSSETFPDVSVQATLDDHATEELRVRATVADQPQFQLQGLQTTDPPFGSYAVGDVAHVKASKGFIQIDKDYRITTITVSVSDAGQESVGLFFDEVI